MGGKLPSTADRRVQRTRRALREALVALILERGWEGFSVQDVCDRADVARSTFYTHFADKEELVGGGFEDLRRGLRAQLAAAAASRAAARFSRGLIEHAHEQRRLFLAVVGKRSGHLVQRRFRELVLGLVREDLADPARRRAAAGRRGRLRRRRVPRAPHLVARGEEPIPPEEVDALFHELVDPVLAAAARPDGTSRAPRGDRGDG